jgi:uncharacterized protein
VIVIEAKDIQNIFNNNGSISSVKKNPIYKIRAHHGLCLFYFRGKGYSSDFVKNMTDVKNNLNKNPIVCITNQADVICGKCPNNLRGKCKTEDKVSEYDRQVLLRCNLSHGATLPYLAFRNLILQNIILPGKRDEICGSCQWTLLCQYPEY